MMVGMFSVAMLSPPLVWMEDSTLNCKDIQTEEFQERGKDHEEDIENKQKREDVMYTKVYPPPQLNPS